ncbi:unnamed protein product [Effrenium voratum]|uniref:Uncharacterized protein n=1 Tax=Effrenium voratum TaxID=2562239 RepID=A0AA36N0G0_9DINO|nr:unnamed protein product [Effrenium voratum]CAJ1424697.1 unnamed protein product [Effrenium voratum]
MAMKAILMGLTGLTGAVGQAMSMHKVIGIECAQVQLDQGYADWLQELAGLQEGPCESSGFTATAGSKEVDLPFLGQLSLAIFRRPDLLDTAMQLGAQLSGHGAKQGQACCETCPRGQQKLVKAGEDECREVCLGAGKKLIVSMAGILEEGFQPDVATCAQRGFPMLNSTVTQGVEPAGLTWDLYHRQPAHTTTQHKVAAGICGEVTLPEEKADSTLSLLGLEAGTCVSAGFSEQMGKQAIPGLSEQLLLFRKAGDLDVVDAVHLLFTALTQDTVTLYSMAGDLCSEASVDRKFQQPLVALHFVEGSCQAQGYRQPAGSQSFSVPLLTDVQLTLFHKAGSFNLHV